VSTERERHRRTVLVWDVPSAVECGKPFTVRLGIKCDSGCRPDGWRLRLCDHEGETRAAVAPSAAPWPGTAALYWAVASLRAPDAEGLYGWQAAADEEAPEEGPAHEPASASFNVRAVRAADCRLTVVAVDRELEAPVEGARVVVHPYRALTNAEGVALLWLPRGRYRIFVSGKGFCPFRRESELMADLTIRAELDLDLPPSDAELWS